MLYNWQRVDWPEFRFDLSRIEGDLLAFADQAGQVGDLLRALSGGGVRMRSVVGVRMPRPCKRSNKCLSLE